MKKHDVTIKNLAQEAHLDTETALLMLLEAGHDYLSGSQPVQKEQLQDVRRVLGLSPTVCKDDPCVVRCLAERAKRSESDIRDLLVSGKLLPKRRLKRIPRHLLKKVEEVLGLRLPAEKPIPKRTPLPRTKTLTSPQPETIRRTREEQQEWPLIGKEQDLLYLSPAEVEDIHWCLVKDYVRTKDPIDPPGVRSTVLLESAAHRPRTSIGLIDKYPTVAMAAAALLHSIVLDHAFHNGNKRTALVSMLAFLDKNGWVMTADQDEVYDFLLSVADHKIVPTAIGPGHDSDQEALFIARWVQVHIRQVTHRELTLQFRQLKPLLNSYGCNMEIASGRGNRINIRRGRLKTQVFYSSDGMDVDRNTVHKIRKDLQLDEAHGYDSDIFYNCGARIPDFINKYRKVLDKLAKV